jgi:hypothetical protein
MEELRRERAQALKTETCEAEDAAATLAAFRRLEVDNGPDLRFDRAASRRYGSGR